MLTLSFSPSSAFITFCASEVEWGATLVKPTSHRSGLSLQSSEIFDRVSSFQLCSVNVPPVVLPLHMALGYLRRGLHGRAIVVRMVNLPVLSYCAVLHAVRCGMLCDLRSADELHRARTRPPRLAGRHPRHLAPFNAYLSAQVRFSYSEKDVACWLGHSMLW
jgi:hypothetical protein